MTSNSGKITGLCGFARDVTETKQLEAQLLQAQKMEAIGTLAGGISHDFNNLLQGILGYAQILLLDKSNDDPDYIKVREIERAARRATELTGQLLAFSRKVELNPRPMNLNQEIRQVEKLLQRTIPKMIEIELQLEEPLQTVNADPGQLEQVILNIGVNARDAMPEGGQLIIQTKDVSLDQNYCRLNPEAKPGPHVCLSIADTGHGMDQETIERIFEPFYTTKETGKGTGLGLAMAYGIIKNHEGHITCNSNPDEGTQFNIYLPAIKVDVEDESAQIEEPITIGRGETLLVVEDESMLRNLAKDMLVRGGYKVIEANSGEEGLKVYQEKGQEISLVILDLIMPGMGGKQCLAEILKIDPQAKVIIASGYAMSDPEMDDIFSSSKGFIKKPYYFRNMLKVIREVLDGESD
jgi:nitrogen-specific signal transduction histidine kinase/CheY-like chemotaxis protein